jgi:acyl-coenzyme A thioesterase PaaI-like protein
MAAWPGPEATRVGVVTPPAETVSGNLMASGVAAGVMPLVDAPWFACFGCSPENPKGLRLRPQRTSAGVVECWVVFESHFCSYPGVVHGGIVGTAADDLMANLLLIERGVLAFSATLRTRFLQPVLAGRPYRIVARVIGARENGYSTEAEMSCDEGKPHAITTGTYTPIRHEHARSFFGLDDDEYERIRPYIWAPERHPTEENDVARRDSGDGARVSPERVVTR